MTLDSLLKILIQFIWVLVVFGGVASLAGLMTWVERKQSALIQDRIGPNRANIRFVRNFRVFGLIHPIADALKMLFKEDFIPEGAYKIMHTLAPIICLTLAFSLFAVVPFAGPLRIRWKDIPSEEIPLIGKFFPNQVLHLSDYKITFQIADLNVGILFVFALSSLIVYGVILAGYSSNNKYSFLGAMRAASQMFSYEVALGLSVVGVIMFYGAVNLGDIVERQGDLWLGIIPKWGIITQPLGFILFLTAAMAEIKRIPFDLPEGESEIIAGYFLEYSSAKFMMFFFAEFVELILLSALITTLFFGGWQVPYLSADGIKIPLLHINIVFSELVFVKSNPWALQLIWLFVTVAQGVAFVFKLCFFCWFITLLRWTYPRFRYDQLMRIGWQRVLPLSMLNIILTGIIIIIEERFKPAVQRIMGY